jgi:protein lifeguard
MAANAKYTAAPQRDSFDTAHYSQAPPSYVDEPSSSSDQAALLGGPRSSEDNIPDDFKVGDCDLILVGWL